MPSSQVFRLQEMMPNELIKLEAVGVPQRNVPKNFRNLMVNTKDL